MTRRFVPFFVLFAACGPEGTDPTTDSDPSSDSDPAADGPDVLEIAVRQLNEGQDLDAFAAARDAFVAQLTAQPGVGTDREFASFMDFSTFAEPSPPVYIGMTQYDDAEAYAAAGEALGTSAEAGAFFSTFTPRLFTVVAPISGDETFDLAGIAAEDGQVLEVAWRDLDAYADFDPEAYAASRDAGLAALRALDGVVAEYQWASADGRYAVGMTVYESAPRFFEIASDPAVMSDPDFSGFLETYPPMGGLVNNVVK